MTPVLRDVRLDGRQLGDLMAPRVADLVPRAQGLRALATGVGDEIDDRLHAREGHERAVVPRVTGLTAGLAPTLDAPTTHTRSAGEAIR